MPIHPQGDQKLLQLETILGTDQGPPKSTKEELYRILHRFKKQLIVGFHCLQPNLTIL